MFTVWLKKTSPPPKKKKQNSWGDLSMQNDQLLKNPPARHPIERFSLPVMYLHFALNVHGFTHVFMAVFPDASDYWISKNVTATIPR